MARESRGLTAAALAELIDVSRQAISQFENGPETPSPDVMRRISETLRYPIHFFLRATGQRDGGAIFYRSLTSATKQMRQRAEQRYRLACEAMAFVKGFVELPPLNLPTLELPRDPLLITDEMIELAAAQVRRHWGLGDGPISDVLLLMEKNGIVVFRHDLGAHELDAFSQWVYSEGRAYIVLGSDKRSAVRSRHDAAHELGHLLMHRDLHESELSKKEVFSTIERQAHAFASAFLMPQATFSADVFSVNLDALRAMKSKWKSSIQSMLMRCRQLNLVSDQEEMRLWKNLARRGWRTQEPLDDVIPQEQPRYLPRAVSLIFRSGSCTPADLTFQTAIPASDIESLLNLPTGTLGVQGDSQSDNLDPPTFRLFG